MSVKMEELDNNMVKLTISIDPVRLEEGLNHAYLTNRNKINMQGFRKGKAPRKLIEVQYGKEIFYEDAVNFVLPDAYEAAIKEHNLDVVSRPVIDIEEIDTEKGAVITAEVYLKPVITIDNYAGIIYKKPEASVTEEEINAEIDKDREKNARILTVTDRPVQNGDTTIIDFEGFIDGVPFEGGKGEDYELIIGSHSFIDTFEDQLIGTNIGEDMDVNVNFPEAYGKEELNGKPALFKVKIKEIKSKELPEVNDELAQDVSEFDTLDEYKSDIKAKLSTRKEAQAERDVEDQVLKGLVEMTGIEVPEPMIETEIDRLIRDMSGRMQMQGLSFDQYLMYTGMTEESLRESYKENAEYNVKARLCIEAVAEKENEEITDEEFEQELDRLAEMYKMERAKLVEAIGENEKDGLRKDMRIQKALKKVIELAIAE